ncbi:DUF3841 domain-containing protein [Microbacteriaceae bacterium 4G12]
MIVYTVQKEAAYKLMRKQGYLEGRAELAMFPEAYRWMTGQMQKRLTNYQGECYPIWVWERRVNRNEPALLSSGRGVILTLDIPEEDILWSSFDEWHSILSESPITYDEAEWLEFEKKDFPESEVQATWERLFDYDWLANRPVEWAGDYSKDWIQGVTTRIRMEQVIRVQRFIPQRRGISKRKRNK